MRMIRRGWLVLGLLLPLTWSRAAAPPRSVSGVARVTRHLAKIAREGDVALYASGLAYHRRDRYGPDVIRSLNENAWGGGLGRSLSMPHGGVASLAFTTFQDSLGEWEYNLGYIREWRSTPAPRRVVFGVGLAAFLISRPDFFDGRPFPAALPVVSIGRDDVALLGTYVPRIPEGSPGMNGDVVYLFARIKL
jgi:palmitoyl transferase